ncbi:MAG: ATP phosphoribosyltransferase [Ruminococcaceae bacterium]|nr:ATP phosphoribosyltransferase [Oscillospiraceae bacterium]
MINVALPKGRLGDSVYALFDKLGYSCPEMTENTRKLVFTNEEKGVSYVLVKPSDVAVYVERGAADIGVVGKDVILETEPDVYELYDLGFGKCALAVASRNDWVDDTRLPLRVATKYPHVAQKYYASINRDIEIIKLNGSIELAPILDLSDVIVDIVETGKTLKENNMGVFTRIAESSARLIANKSSYQFKKAEIENLISGVEALI